ncbi:hypothetical protein [Desulfofustis glycolicus]|uniref:hypothetical protein n=1 Tax=Desulfofustis glycolicus TaxID=51195 RepID=UPI0011611CE9|nr:hypothetical protein [Desulfofustis glycolicus]MCB2215824.1 hypothetical protein [Desulfobulbaceae bacterium]
MKDEAYIKAIGHILFSFQMLEEGLKICVGLSYDIISAVVPSELSFKVNAKKIEKSSLGSLITLFSDVTKNHSLVTDLKNIVQWRNFCAHNAYLHEFQNRNDQSNFSNHSIEDLVKVLKHLNELVNRVGIEVAKLREVQKKLE